VKPSLSFYRPRLMVRLPLLSLWGRDAEERGLDHI
jgi:hypothetical protein